MVHRTSVPVTHVRKQLSFLVTIIVLCNDIPCREKSALNVDGFSSCLYHLISMQSALLFTANTDRHSWTWLGSSFAEKSAKEILCLLVLMTVCSDEPWRAKDLLRLVSQDLFQDRIGIFGIHRLLQMLGAGVCYFLQDLTKALRSWNI